MKFRRPFATFVGAALVLIVTACGDKEPVSEAGNGGFVAQETGSETEGDGDVPDFEGPWRPLFADVYANAGSDFTREVLRDGVITEAEALEVWQRIQECTMAGGSDMVISASADATGRVNPQVAMNPEQRVQSDAELERDRKLQESCRSEFDGPIDLGGITSIFNQQVFFADAPLDAEARDRQTFACFQRLGFLGQDIAFEEFWRMVDPCPMPVTDEEVAAAENTECWGRIVPLEGRSWDEVQPELAESGVRIGGGFSDGNWFFEFNPDRPESAQTFPDGREIFGKEAQLCWTAPNQG